METSGYRIIRSWRDQSINSNLKPPSRIHQDPTEVFGFGDQQEQVSPLMQDRTIPWPLTNYRTSGLTVTKVKKPSF